MAIYRRGKVWWYSFTFNGARVQSSTKQGNRKAAVQIEAAYRTQLAKGEVGINEPKAVPTFAAFSAWFKNKMVADHANKPKTSAYYEVCLKHLLDFPGFQRARLDQIRAPMISDFVEWRRKAKRSGGRTIKVATINRDLEVLRRLLRLAQTAGEGCRHSPNLPAAG